jgi:Flp pilus assembly protein TadD
VRYLAGRIDAALADAERALAIGPRSAPVLSLRGLIREKLGARDEALADFRQALALDPNLPQAAEALRRLGVTP